MAARSGSASPYRPSGSQGSVAPAGAKGWLRRSHSRSPLKMPAREDQDPIQTLVPHAADPAPAFAFARGGRDRCPDHLDPFRAEDLVEGRS
jgi:hypothetical protein